MQQEDLQANHMTVVAEMRKSVEKGSQESLVAIVMQKFGNSEKI